MTATLLLRLFDAETARTRAVLEAVPGDALDWSPHPRAFTLGRLAMHVATLPGWMAAYTERDGYDMGRGGPGPAVPPDVAAILATHEAATTRGRAALASCPDEVLAQPWTLWRDGSVVQQFTRAEAVVTFALHHLVHHRGQLTVYLRLKHVPLPALYGDSADHPLLPPAGEPSGDIR